MISVVIPAYNAARWLPHTLKSVAAQGMGDRLDVIVVDDGSTDNTAALVGHDPTVRYIYQPNSGQAAARNTGIRAARGEYIALLDADDMWVPEKLRLQHALLTQRNLAWVYSDIWFLDTVTGNVSHTYGEAGRLREGNILEALFMDMVIAPSSTLIRRTVFDEVGFFDETPLMRNREDWDMFLRIAARYPVGLINQPLVWYRVHPQSSIAAEQLATTFAGTMLLIEQAVAREPQRLAPLRTTAIARLCLRTAAYQAIGRQPYAARRMLARSLNVSPHTLVSTVQLLLGPPGKSRYAHIRRLLRWLHFKWKRQTHTAPPTSSYD